MQAPRQCTDCGSSRLLYNNDTGEISCKACGSVLEDRMIDIGPERGKINEDGQSTSTGRGTPVSALRPEIGTEVGSREDRRALRGSARIKWDRLAKWHNRTASAIERNLRLANSEIKRVSSLLKVPERVTEETARIYQQAVQRGLVRGRSTEVVVSSAIYAACRTHEIPRTLDEISCASGIEKTEIGRTYRFVTRELAILIAPSSPVFYIERFASNLKLSPNSQTRAVEILEDAQKHKLMSGRGPAGLAAAALYVAALARGEKRTQREVADAAGVTEVTIRNRYKELVEKLKLHEKKSMKS